MHDQSGTSAPQMDPATRLAYNRTWLAFERTMQAWIRTAASLITFGFSVSKFSDIFGHDVNKKYLIGPHEFGFVLVCIGLAALLFSALDYRRNVRQLASEFGGSPRSMAVQFGALIAALGIFALILMLVRT